MILIDTSGLLSALDESQRYHRECANLLAEASPPLLLSPFVLAELDYLLVGSTSLALTTESAATACRAARGSR